MRELLRGVRKQLGNCAEVRECRGLEAVRLEMARRDPEKSAIEKFEESVLVTVEDDEVRDRVVAILDIWRRYLASAGKRKQTPRVIADILFSRLAAWISRSKAAPHHGLTLEELDAEVVDFVGPDAIRKAFDRIESVLTKVGVSAERLSRGPMEASQKEKFRYLIGGVWHHVMVNGPTFEQRGDSDERIWLSADFAVDNQPVTLGRFELQRGRAPATLARPADWLYLQGFGVSFVERVPRLFLANLPVAEILQTPEARTSVRALFSTADGYMSELGLAGGWDRPPSCLAHLSTTRGPHRWTDPDPLELGCVFTDGRQSAMWLECSTSPRRDDDFVGLTVEVRLAPRTACAFWFIHLGEHRAPDTLGSITLEFVIQRSHTALDLAGTDNRDEVFLNRVASNASVAFAIRSRESRSFTVDLADDISATVFPWTDQRFAHLAFQFRKRSPISAEELQRQVFSLDFARIAGTFAFPMSSWAIVAQPKSPSERPR